MKKKKIMKKKNFICLYWQSIFFNKRAILHDCLSGLFLHYVITKPGGLDVETNRDRDRERP